MRLDLIAAATAVLTAGSAAAETHIVHIVSDYENLRFVFEPASLTIAPGDTVTWVNDADEEHNVIAYPGGFPRGASSFQSRYLTAAGETYSMTFDVPGTYQYHCLPHLLMGMKGEVVVGTRSAQNEFHTPTRSEILTYRAQLLEWFDEEDNLMQIRLAEKNSRTPG